MRTNDLWSAKADCCGCELCARSCPKQIIGMKQDEEGFLYPQIADGTDCIDCKRCISVCPLKKPGRSPVHFSGSFSFSLPKEEDLKKSASGGIATAVSRAFIREGGVVYGVAYTDDCKGICYQRATTEEQLEPFRGSKYAQAVKGKVYEQVKQDIKEGRKVLFIGLPCEVSAIYHAVSNQENLYTISLICHGPTSQKVHRDYLEGLPGSSGKMSFLNVRYKKVGWKPYYIHVEYEDGTLFEEEWSKSDYGIAFQYLKRPSCHSCKYKSENMDFGLQSDMTIGDYHALKKGAPWYNRWGVSQASIQTEKGRYLAGLTGHDIISTEIPESKILISNRALHQSIPVRGNRKRFVKDYLGQSLHFATHTMMVRRNDAMVKIGRKLMRLKAIKRVPQVFKNLLGK